jgi:hypothetical protein
MSLESDRLNMNLLLFDLAYSFKTEQDWRVAQDYVLRWFASLKVDESYETFDEAFQDSRMTVRCILQTRQAGYYEEKVPIRGKESEGGVRTIKTMQGVPGIKERMAPSNFFGEGAENREKYNKGLFDVSGVLLDGKRSLKLGGDLTTKNQMYRTTGDTVYVFMPVPRQEDMIIFCMLCGLAKYERPGSQGLKIFAQYMKSRLTRIKLAFEGDAGCKFLDFSPAGEEQPKFRYGFGKIMKGTATDEEVRKRKVDANLYKNVLLGTNRNEIVIAYRQHGCLSMASSFPVYAKGVFSPNNGEATGACGSCGQQKGFVVVDENMKPTGDIITLKGLKQAGTAKDLGGFMTRAGGCDCKPS